MCVYQDKGNCAADRAEQTNRRVDWGRGYVNLKLQNIPYLDVRSAKCIPWGVLPSKRLLGMCRWMGSHFHNWTDYNGVTFLVELLEWGRKFSGFLG